MTREIYKPFSVISNLKCPANRKVRRIWQNTVGKARCQLVKYGWSTGPLTNYILKLICLPPLPHLFWHALWKRETNGLKPDPEVIGHDQHDDLPEMVNISALGIDCVPWALLCLELKITQRQVALRGARQAPCSSVAPLFLLIFKWQLN